MTTAESLLEQKGRELFMIGPEAPVLEALKLMAERGIGAVLVMDGQRLVGILSERDYARKVVLLGRASHDTPVRSIMSTPVYTVTTAASLDHCMREMTERRVRHLPVVDSANRVVGVLSIGDLVKAMLEEQTRTIEQLREYIHS